MSIIQGRYLKIVQEYFYSDKIEIPTMHSLRTNTHLTFGFIKANTDVGNAPHGNYTQYQTKFQKSFSFCAPMHLCVCKISSVKIR